MLLTCRKKSYCILENFSNNAALDKPRLHLETLKVYVIKKAFLCVPLIFSFMTCYNDLLFYFDLKFKSVNLCHSKQQT